jgi:hypothetical protein
MMGTKANPSPIDAYAAALPDEPIFTLAASDPLASQIVGIWAAVRLGDLDAARRAFDRMIELFGPVYAAEPDWYRGESAYHVATDMLAWARQHPTGAARPQDVFGEALPG